MNIFSTLTIVFTLISNNSNAAINVDSIVSKVKAHSCAVTLAGQKKPLLLVVGLGNYGYGATRHNIGDELTRIFEERAQSESIEAPEFWNHYLAQNEEDAERYIQFSGASSPRRIDGLTIEYRVGGRVALPPVESPLSNVLFVHPYYDINESGYFVSQLVKELNITTEQVVVIVDDITLARNQIILGVGKTDGSGDGHNGLKSINFLLGNGAYYRLRVGVSNPKTEKLDISRSDWVLGQIPESDMQSLTTAEKLQKFEELLLNIQQRTSPEARKDKLVGDGQKILKIINSP